MPRLAQRMTRPTGGPGKMPLRPPAGLGFDFGLNKPQRTRNPAPAPRTPHRARGRPGAARGTQTQAGPAETGLAAPLVVREVSVSKYYFQ